MRPLRSAQFVNRWTQAATIVTVGSGLLVPANVLQVPQVWFVSLSAVYLALLTVGMYFTERAERAWTLPVYFVVTTASLFALLAAAQGWVWLIGLPLLSHVVLFTSWRWALVWSASMLGVVFSVVPPTTEWVRVATGIGAAMVFVVAFSVIARREVEWRLRSEQLSESLAKANQQLRSHADSVAELSAMRERNRVAREVHDGLGHYLTTIHVQLEAARALLDRDLARARQGIERAQLLAKQGLEDVRESVSLLRSTTRDAEPFETVLEGLLYPDSEEARPLVSLEVTGVRRRVPDTVQHALRRVLQEALTNVRRHSDAKRVEVRLCFEAQHILLDVEDDGTAGSKRTGGENTNAVDRRQASSTIEEPQRTGHGLLGISERVHLLGGNATFGATPSGGFRLQVTVPA